MKRFYKKITKVLSALVISVAALCFVSCGDILNFLIPVLFGQISEFTAIPGNGYVSLTWENGYASGYLYLETKVTGTNSVIQEDCDWLDPDEQGFLPSSCFVDGLTNGTDYTFTLYLFEQRNTSSSCISSVSARATPSESAGGNGSTTLNVESGVYFKELNSDMSSITITGANGKMITYANVNTGTTGIIKSGVARRYISSSRSVAAGIQEVSSAAVENAGKSASPVRHFVAPESVTTLPNADRSGASGDTFNKNDPQIGATRSIYVDTDSDLQNFRQERMTLYAIGYKPGTTANSATKENIACLVWAKASDVETTPYNSVSTKISLGVIQDIALKFVQHYQFEEGVFGTTCNELLSGGSATYSMSDYGPTKDWVNIVLYDIGRDGTSGNCGVVGYFWAKDYYRTGVSTSSSNPISLTNEGKYFYVDVPFCNYNSSTGRYDTLNGSVSGTVISTLFHEYQHMINYNTKDIELDINSNCTWYNEMLSMLCEDIMGEQLGLNSEDLVATGRIKNFNAYYYYSGIAQYLETNSWISYGTAYAFGAWLARNYGGVPLINAISTNNKIGIDSILDAITEVNGVSRTWDELMTEYIQACAFRTAFSANNGLETFNVVPGTSYSTRINGAGANTTLYVRYGIQNHDDLVDESVTNTLVGSLKGINLWSDSYKNKNTCGPVILGSNSAVDVQPTGFVFHNVGRIDTNEPVTLRFTTSSNQYEKLYIFVQDARASNYPDTTAEVIQH